MDHALLVLCALLLNAALGGPRRLYASLGLTHLEQRPARFIRDIERKLNREHRTLKEREMRGLVCAAFVALLSLFLGFVFRGLLTQNLRFFELLLLAALLPVRPAWDLASELHAALKTKQLNAARAVFEGTPWRHHALLDEYALTRAGIETLAVHFSEKILAPVCWYLLFGLPGFFMCKAATLLHESMLQPARQPGGFASGPEWLHALVQWVPSRLSACLWLVTSLFFPPPNAQAARAQFMAKFTTASAGQIELLSPALLLNLSLGGPSSLYSSEWLGMGTPKPAAGDLKRAQFSFVLLNVLLFIALGFFL